MVGFLSNFRAPQKYYRTMIGWNRYELFSMEYFKRLKRMLTQIYQKYTIFLALHSLTIFSVEGGKIRSPFYYFCC